MKCQPNIPRSSSRRFMRYGWQLGLTILWLIDLTMTAFMHNEDVTPSESAPRAHTWKRLDGIDLLRGLSIFFVLMNHITSACSVLRFHIQSFCRHSWSTFSSGMPNSVCRCFLPSRVFSSPRSLSGAGVHFRRFPCAASIYFGLRVSHRCCFCCLRFYAHCISQTCTTT